MDFIYIMVVVHVGSGEDTEASVVGVLVGEFTMRRGQDHHRHTSIREKSD